MPATRTCALNHHPPCRGPLSGEHYISKSVLRHLFTGKNGYITGVPWAQDGFKPVSYEGLTAKILCIGHNSDLTSLDTLAGRLFRLIKEAQLELQAGSHKSSTNTFNGFALERWLLKVAFGMWASGNLAHNGVRLEGGPPSLWGDILMGADFPPGWGLYMPVSGGEIYLSEQEFELRPATSPEGPTGVTQLRNEVPCPSP